MDNYIVIIGRHWTLILILHGIESPLRGKENIVEHVEQLRFSERKQSKSDWRDGLKVIPEISIKQTEISPNITQNWFFVVLNPDLNKQKQR